MKEVALITIHGMGKKEETYYADLQAALQNQLTPEEWGNISFQNIQYADILQDPQDALWESIVKDPDTDMDATGLRKFFLYGFSDAGSLEYSAHRDRVAYLAVQAEIQRALKAAFNDLGQNKEKPVVIIAQSLGCQVISNYLWDASKDQYIFANFVNDQSDGMEFLRLRSLAHLITTGCNIPLFIGGLSQRKCFAKPNSQFKWDNYYDSNDVLGWPVRQLDDSFKIANDHPVNIGGIFTSWNPFSHVGYWSDRDVYRPVAAILRDLLLRDLLPSS